MRNLIALVLILLVGCQQSDIKANRLWDTLEVLKRKADFKPLKAEEVYRFLNEYYLPQLDTFPTKRKIFLYPLRGKDFKWIYNEHKKVLEAEYRSDSIWLKKYKALPPIPPNPLLFDGKQRWNAKKLKRTEVVADINLWHPSNTDEHHKSIDDNEAWHKKFGYGYMCISYPVYNANTKKLFLREWVENAEWCGTGRERELWYENVNGKWQLCD